MSPPRLALLFDLDGTMVDTDPLHLAAFNEVLQPYGRQIDLGFYKARIMGFSNPLIMAAVLPNGTAAEHATFIAEKEAAFVARIGALEPTAGLTELLVWATDRNVARAVVTNAPRESAALLLDGLGIADAFDEIVIGVELARAKPDPLPYLTALDLLGAVPARAVAFEDSLSGMTAAAASGVHTVGVTTGLEPQALALAGAQRTVRDFTDPDLLTWLEGFLD